MENIRNSILGGYFPEYKEQMMAQLGY